MRKIFYSFWIVLFFVGIIVPLFHMNTAEITNQENRTLSKFPAIKKQDKPNYEFGKEFESWLGDRFWGRNQLIDARFQTMYKINGRIENDRAFVGDDGWMFMKNGVVNLPSSKLQEEKVKKVANIYKEFREKVKNKNIPIYLVLLPDRGLTYEYKWTNYYKKKHINYAERIIQLLKDTPNFYIINLSNELAGMSKKENMAYKEDIHYNAVGTNILRNKIYNEFKKNYFPNYDLKYKIFLAQRKSKDRFNIGNFLKIKNNTPNKTIEDFFIDKVEFNQPYSLSILSHDIRQNYWPRFEKTSSNSYLIDKNLLIQGFCYAQGFNRILAPIFKNTYYFRIYNSDDTKSYYYSHQSMFLKLINNKTIILLFEDIPNFTEANKLKKLLQSTKNFDASNQCSLILKHNEDWLDCVEINKNKIKRLENGDTANFKKEKNIYTIEWDKTPIIDTFECDIDDVCTLQSSINKEYPLIGRNIK